MPLKAEIFYFNITMEFIDRYYRIHPDIISNTSMNRNGFRDNEQRVTIQREDREIELRESARRERERRERERREREMRDTERDQL